MHLYKIFVLTFAGSLTLSPYCRAADTHVDGADRRNDVEQSVSASVGWPGIVLRRLADGSTAIDVASNVLPTLRNNDLSFSSDSRLIKIGKVYAKDKSVVDLTKMLSGPVDSKVDLLLIQGDQQIVKALRRYVPETVQGAAQVYGPLLNISDLFTGRGDGTDELVQMGKNHHFSGNNFAAAPYFIAAATCPKFLFAPLYAEPSIALPSSLDFYARTGMLNRFDALATTTMKFSESRSENCTSEDAALLTECADVLARNGSLDKARTLHNRLLSKLPTVSLESKFSILLGRAALSENESSALECYKQALTLCAQSENLPQDFLLDTLHTIVSFSSKCKSWELARAAQLQVVDLSSKPEGWQRHLQCQKAVAAYLRLSQIYELSGDLILSQAALQKAASLYKEKLNDQEQILVERLGFPCLSEVQLHLAHSYTFSKQFDLALLEIEKAEKLVSDALGSDSPVVGEINKVKQALLGQKGGSVKQFTNLFAFLDGLKLQVTDASENGDSLLARQAYDCIATNPPKAAASINTLLEHELAKSSHTADNVTRLINLIASMNTVIGRQQALNMLRRLDTCFKGPGAHLSLNRLQQLTELALLTDGDSQDSPAYTYWTNLETLLDQLEFAQFNNRENNPSDSARKRFTRLLCVSYVYAFRGETDKALRLLKYVRKNYPTVSERDYSPLAYEAILYVLQNRMSDAQKLIDGLMVASSGSHFDNSKMLCALSSALYQTGYSELGLKVLAFDADPKLTNSKKVLAYQSALIKFRLGKFEDALSELGGDDSGITLSGQQNLNLRFLKAALFAETGKTDEAILTYLTVAGGGSAQSQAFEQAVRLAKTIKALPPTTIRVIIDSAQQQRRIFESGQGIENLKFISDLAKVQGFSSDSLNSLNAWLTSLEFAHGSVDDALASCRQRAKSLEDAHKPNASNEWANLARMYLGKGQYAEFTATMLHALTIYSGEFFNNSMYHPGNLRGDLGITSLIKARKFREAEQILKQCIAIRKTPGLTKCAYIEKSLLADLFIEEGNFEQAKTWAEALLLTFSEDGGVCSPHGSIMRGYLFYSVVDQFTDKKQFAIAQSLLDQATKTQLAVVGPRNALFIENYQSYAKLFAAKNNLSSAEEYARKALDLESWIGRSGNTGKISASLLASILRQEGKNTEADSISVTSLRPARRSQDWQKLYNTRYFHHSVAPELYANKAEEPLKQALSDAIELDGEGSASAKKAFDDLTKFYVQQMRYDDAEALQLRELRILDNQYGKCIEAKFGCMLNLAEIYLLVGKSEKALKFAQQIKTAPAAEVIYFHISKNQMRLAKVLYAVGEKDRALELARKVESFLLDTSRHAGFNPPDILDDCLHFMEHAGAIADTDALRKLQNSIAAQRYPQPK